MSAPEDELDREPQDAAVSGSDVPDGEPDDEVDEDDEDDPPRVILGRVGDIRSWLSPQLAHRHRDRPMWFVLAMDEDFVGVLESIPEGPMPPQESSSILGGMREFAAEASDRLQEWLGPTDSIVFGFHASASFDDVRKAFDDDGFLVVGLLRDGKVFET